ncbi:MAG: redoxin domain-containing protein, partial [Gemmatimonadetes bacterium]|nr:redoxin domain-containing protein [Gemmatimonadota bacterium]
LGPDGRIYVLARGASGAADRLVVLDQDGIWVRTAGVAPAGAIFADRDGRLYIVRKDGALARTGEPERAPFPDFELPALLEPSIIRLEELRGKIVVLNFWASWCGPCRQEMPLLDAYARDASGDGVVILGLNEDVDADDGRAFVRQLGVTYPNAEGRGRLKERYRYRGLPYTVVLDRELRVVKAIYGFGGSIEPIRAAVTAASGESLQPRLRQDQQ